MKGQAGPLGDTGALGAAGEKVGWKRVVVVSQTGSPPACLYISRYNMHG